MRIGLLLTVLGIYILTILGCGGGGGGSSSVQPPASDSTAPTVSLSSPTASSSNLSSATLLIANATDDVGVSGVEFYLDGTLLYTTSVAPYRYIWDTALAPVGSHTLSVKAYDAANNSGTSVPLGVTVSHPSISATMSTVVTGNTAIGTVSLAGVSAAVFGLNLQIFSPTGATIASLDLPAANSSFSALQGTTDITGTFVAIAGPENPPGLQSGQTLTVHFSNLPAGTTSADFGVSLLAVFGAGGVPIQ
jgi:hypothetical protein